MNSELETLIHTRNILQAKLLVVTREISKLRFAEYRANRTIAANGKRHRGTPETESAEAKAEIVTTLLAQLKQEQR